MTVTHALARPLLAGIFVYAGIDAVRKPESKALQAEEVAAALAEPLGLPRDTVTLVRINGAVQVVGGTLLAIGKVPRLAALVLAGSLVPTTYAGHAFWSESDQAKRAQQRTQFLKNTAVLGGLLMAASDTGGRPSLQWRARRAAKRARRATRGASHGAAGLVGQSAGVVGHGAAGLVGQSAEAVGHGAARLGRELPRAASGATLVRHQAAKLSRRAARATRRAAHDAATGPAATAAALATRRAGSRATHQGEVLVDYARETAGHARETAGRTLDAARNGALDQAMDLARDTVGRAREVFPN